MGNKQVVAVVIRLMSIALFIYAIRYIPSIITGFESNVPRWINFHSLGLVISMLIVAGVLWTFPHTITRKIIPQNINIDEIKIEKDSILSLGFIILGMYLLFYTIGDLIFWVYVFLGVPELTADQKVNVFITVVELAISLVLIFGSRGISNIILTLRGR